MTKSQFIAIHQDELIDAIQRRMTTLDNPGFCLECEEEVSGCEPDARGYDCECCGAKKSVFAPEELLLF